MARIGDPELLRGVYIRSGHSRVVRNAAINTVIVVGYLLMWAVVLFLILH